MTRCDSNSHARDVGGEEVNAVAVEVAAGAVEVAAGAVEVAAGAVEVAAGAVVVLGGAGVGIRARICRSVTWVLRSRDLRFAGDAARG
jgi:hypothetical protein